MRRRILGIVAAAAVATTGVIVMTESPAEAHGNCKLIHLTLGSNPSWDNLLHICL